ncbi:hypothetical protein SFR_2116 [Streptomyces sp. FR-008]|nr:hypothetical protein SFR_2116 [Streptomyces sp. FR-008]
MLDVDLFVRDALAVHLALQPTAVSAPGGAVHRHSARHVPTLLDRSAVYPDGHTW